MIDHTQSSWKFNDKRQVVKDLAGKQCQHANQVVPEAAMNAGSVECKQVEQGPVRPRPEWIDISPTVRRVGSHVEIHRFTISDIIVRGYAGKEVSR